MSQSYIARAGLKLRLGLGGTAGTAVTDDDTLLDQFVTSTNDWIEHETWRPIGELEMFPIGSVTQAVVVHDRESWPAAYGERGVFVWRRADADLVVFSRQCTDLGCPLEYERGSGCFLCPCHGGIFGPDGQRLAGPPKSPLHRYAHRIREAILEVDISSIPPAA